MGPSENIDGVVTSSLLLHCDHVLSVVLKVDGWGKEGTLRTETLDRWCYTPSVHRCPFLINIRNFDFGPFKSDDRLSTAMVNGVLHSFNRKSTKVGGRKVC